MAIHEYVWNTLFDASQDRSAWMGFRAFVVSWSDYDGSWPTHGYVWNKVALFLH